MSDFPHGSEPRDAFQVSVSTLTLGTLYEAVLSFSSQDRFETFWPSVCLNARWFIPSRRTGILLCRPDGVVEVVGTFEQGKFQWPPRPELDTAGDRLKRMLSHPHAQWIKEPWNELQHEPQDFLHWLLRDRPDTLFVVPLRVRGKNVGAMLFVVGRLEEKDQAMLNTLGTIYALHVGMAYALLRLGEERRAMQEQLLLQEKMASLGGLVAGILHEINSPLGVVRSANDVSARCAARMEEVLGASGDPVASGQLQKALEVLRANTESIGAAGRRITEIVTSLRNFARLDEAEYQTADVHEGIDSTLTLIESELTDRITVIRDYGEIPEIRCFPGQLNQVFMGFLKNALEAIEGPGTVRVRTFLAGNEAHIEITDTGRGIPPEKLKKLFEFDFTKRGARVKMGTGLATAYRIVENHGGRIEVQSELGHGSTFRVVLPTGEGSNVNESDPHHGS